MVGLNVVLSLINVVYLWRMLRSRHDAHAYTVLEVEPDDRYLAHVLHVHREDIARYNPGFTHDPHGDHSAYLVLKGDETVGVVVVEQDGDTGHVRLDYVTPRYRDFTPGRFVWRQSGLLAGRGLRRVVTSPTMVEAYYDRLGFRRDGQSWVLDL